MKRVIKIGIFIILFAAQFAIITNIMNYKGDAAINRCFYSYKENTMDVIFFGTSKVYANINPCVLWKEHKIASFDFAGSSKPMWNTYYDIQEALKYQDPQVIVVDVYGVAGRSDFSSLERAIIHVMGLRTSLNKWEDIKASVAEDDNRIAFLLNYPIYHSRYKELTVGDYQYNFSKEHPRFLPGTIIRYNTEPQTPKIDIDQVKETIELYEKQEDYLCKIIELCHDRNIPLLLVSAPSCLSEESQKEINAVWEIAEDYKVPYLDFNKMYEEVGIDFSEDFSDEGHLNFKGSEKYTKYLGDYLSNQYTWKDKNNGFDDTMWVKSTKYYYSRVADMEMAMINDLRSYLKALSDDRLIYIVSVRAGGCGEEMEAYLRMCGVSGLTLVNGGVCMIDGMRCIFDSGGADEFHNVVDLENNYLEVKKEEGAVEQLIFNGKDYRTNVDGINIIVYDKETKSFADRVAFDIQNLEMRFIEK